MPRKRSDGWWGYPTPGSSCGTEIEQLFILGCRVDAPGWWGYSTPGSSCGTETEPPRENKAIRNWARAVNFKIKKSSHYIPYWSGSEAHTCFCVNSTAYYHFVTKIRKAASIFRTRVLPKKSCDPAGSGTSSGIMIHIPVPGTGRMVMLLSTNTGYISSLILHRIKPKRRCS